jgi:hypothetical protein
LTQNVNGFHKVRQVPDEGEIGRKSTLAWIMPLILRRNSSTRREQATHHIPSSLIEISWERLSSKVSDGGITSPLQEILREKRAKGVRDL